MLLVCRLWFCINSKMQKKRVQIVDYYRFIDIKDWKRPQMKCNFIRAKIKNISAKKAY